MARMRKEYCMSEEQMPTWRLICEEWAKKHNAELLFVNETSFGVQIDGGFHHIYIDELQDMLSKESQSEIEQSHNQSDVELDR